MVKLDPTTWPFEPAILASTEKHLTSGFVKITAGLPWHVAMETTISAVAKVVEALEIRPQNATSVTVTLVELRNRAQHLVLSLPCIPSFVNSGNGYQDNKPQTEHRFGGADRSGLLYEIIRISLLIYNNLIVYPMSLSTGLETRLAKKLKCLLLPFFSHEAFTSGAYDDILVWSIMLGGISTEDIRDREWYQYWYCNVTRNYANLKRWRCVEDLLSSFLWLDFVLNEEAVKFWVACTEMGRSLNFS